MQPDWWMEKLRRMLNCRFRGLDGLYSTRLHVMIQIVAIGQSLLE